MIIKFTCNNHCADFQKDEIELISESRSQRFCAFCGEKLTITNLDEIVAYDIDKRAEEYINKWLKEMGGDETLSLVQRHVSHSCYRIYKEILQRKGFIIK